MSRRVAIGLIGDHNDTIPAHRAIPQALTLAARALGIEVAHEWVPSEQITSVAHLTHYHGLWCIPGSPYRDMDGVLLAIRYAREQQRPFLGTCGGFQHALIEYARNVLQWSDADHAESSPDAMRAVIAPLTCGLLSDFGSLRLIEGTRLAQAYGTLHIAEEYLCSYGVNPAFRTALVTGPLRESAVDESGDLRAIELDTHAFFVGTLFQPERAALRGETPPPVVAFLQACLTKLSEPLAQ
jgi:CTP synthase (UTP-ammonia lyase)